MNRRFLALCAASLSFGLGLTGAAIELASPANAAAPPVECSSNPSSNNCQTTHNKNGANHCSPLTRSISGAIRGYDGKAVNAFIGLDMTDATGKLVDGGGCSGAQRDPVTTYGITVHVNYKVNYDGAPASTPGVTMTWNAVIPANVAKIYFEVTPKDDSSKPIYGTTNQTTYGNSMRPAIAITKDDQVISVLNMPVNACGNLSTGGLKGWIYKGGKRVKVSYVAAFSQGSKGSGTPAGNGPFGFNNVTYSTPTDTYRIPKLASGNSKGQSYTIIAKLSTGESKQFYMLDAHGIQHGGVLACKDTSFNLTF